MSAAPVVVALGEVLWDMFPDGSRFGGAPANFACHAAALGADASLVSRVGDDEPGRSALAELARHRVGARHVTVDRMRPTGAVQVVLNDAGVPGYTIAPDVAWDHIEPPGELTPAPDAVCFGTLGQRGNASRETIRQCVAATPASALRIFDVNLRPPFFDDALIRDSLTLANIFKLSDEELEAVARACGVSGSTTEILDALMSEYGLRSIALTRGTRGALLVGQNEFSDCAGVPVTVRDTVGAGDAFTAALTIGLLRGNSLATINRRACAVAAYVCTQAGATPTLPDEFKTP